MKVLMFAWKDIQNPAAGGAEAVTWKLLKEFNSRGLATTLFTSRYSLKQPTHEVLDGVEIYRAGGRYGVYFWAIFYYFKYFRGRFDVIVDQINTLPFFTPLFVREPKVAFIHQLARQIWFYETRLPFSVLGFILESFFLFWYRNLTTITGSPSTVEDLKKLGFKKIVLIPYFISLWPLAELKPKDEGLKILFVGRLVPGKRPLDVLVAFKKIRLEIPFAQLLVVGRGTASYQALFEKRARAWNLWSAIIFYPHATDEVRDQVLRQAHLLLVTSIKEGWGLVVTEANSQGTPALVYNVDGLRDSVQNGRTGLICEKNTPEELAKLCLKLYRDPKLYETLRFNAWRDSQKYTVEKSVGLWLGTLKSL